MHRPWQNWTAVAELSKHLRSKLYNEEIIDYNRLFSWSINKLTFLEFTIFTNKIHKWNKIWPVVCSDLKNTKERDDHSRNDAAMTTDMCIFMSECLVSIFFFYAFLMSGCLHSSSHRFQRLPQTNRWFLIHEAARRARVSCSYHQLLWRTHAHTQTCTALSQYPLCRLLSLSTSGLCWEFSVTVAPML